MAMTLFACTSLLLHHALGAADWIDLSEAWRFQPDPQNVGSAEEWQLPELDDEAWAVLTAGTRWEDQGFPSVDGYAWYRRSVNVPAAWQAEKVWLVLGAVNDSCVVFCNGQQVNSFGDHTEHSVASVSLIVELSGALRYGAENLLAIQVFDWGASGGLWRPPCALTTNLEKVPMESALACFVDYENRTATVDIDFGGLGNKRPDATLHARLFDADGKQLIAEKTVPVAQDAPAASLTFPLPDAEPGARLRIDAAAEGPDGQPIAGVVASVDVEWPEPSVWPGRYASLKVLNNFVTELLSQPVPADASQDLAFLNPRDGWVFVALSNCADGNPTARIDDGPPLVWRVNPETGAFEAMQWLHEGEHRLRVESPVAAQLDVRAVPELAYCYYPATPLIAAFGDYDWAFCQRHVLPHVNALVTSGGFAPDEFETWRKEGRFWISNATLPGLGRTEPPTVDEAYGIWSQNPGVTEPGYAGLIVDEFLSDGAAHYGAWTGAVRRLDARPDFANRTFYAWCGTLSDHPQSYAFCRYLMDKRHRFVWERYLHEYPTPEEARRAMYREVQYPFKKWRETMPGIEQLMVVCLGYLCAPPETQNLNPAVDYQVFLDMQFRFLATDPTFFGLYGLMEYSTRYADEESLRYAHKLYRHYCIDGNRTPLTRDPYVLPHLKNPDFAEGLDGWTVEAAEPGAIGIDRMEGFSHLQGRYPKVEEGDQFCLMKRSAEAPNRVRQTIRALEPGRLYSLKLIAADIGQLHEKQSIGLHVDIDGVEKLDKYGFEYVYPSCYSHEVGPYTRENPAYFQFHRLVFRAASETAKLTISDWASPTSPEGPAGQAIAFNFVEVQPFHEP